MNIKNDSIKTNNIVYMYTNIVNSKVYIGRTMQPIEVRAGMNGQGYRTCTKFWNAICKYGWENFKLEILCENLTYEESVEMESHYIEKYRSTEQGYGYNILKQEPNRGSMPEEVKEKIRESKKHLTPEQRKRISDAHMGQNPWNKGIKTGPLTDEQKANFSKAREGNKNSIHVAVRNIDTGETFRSGAEAGRSIGVTSEAIFAAIKNSKPCKGQHFERICN